jgi:hypothetical protein
LWKIGFEPITSCLPGTLANELIPNTLANITLFCIQRQIKTTFYSDKGDFLHNILTLHKKATMELPKPMGSLTTTINNTIATVQFSHPASNSFQEIVRLVKRGVESAQH